MTKPQLYGEYVPEPSDPPATDPLPTPVPHVTGGEKPEQSIGGQPTHYLVREGSVEIVDASSGYDPANPLLHPLPDGFWGGLPRCWRDGAWRVDVDVICAGKRAEIEARTAEAFLVGYPATVGALAGHRLQVRHNDDRTNWLTSQAVYSAAVAAGTGAISGATFRTALNENVILTYAEGLQELLGMAAWGASIMAVTWALKDALAQAGDDPQAIADVDVENAPWPS